MCLILITEIVKEHAGVHFSKTKYIYIFLPLYKNKCLQKISSLTF